MARSFFQQVVSCGIALKALQPGTLLCEYLDVVGPSRIPFPRRFKFLTRLAFLSSPGLQIPVPGADAWASRDLAKSVMRYFPFFFS